MPRPKRSRSFPLLRNMEDPEQLQKMAKDFEAKEDAASSQAGAQTDDGVDRNYGEEWLLKTGHDPRQVPGA
jgi:hypothetical protein